MTVLQALKNRVNYPLTDLQVQEKLEGRDVFPFDDFSASVANSRAFQLAYADLLRFLVTMVNLSQNGSITAQNMAGIRGTANAIYKQYGEPLIGETVDSRPVIKLY